MNYVDTLMLMSIPSEIIDFERNCIHQGGAFFNNNELLRTISRVSKDTSINDIEVVTLMSNNYDFVDILSSEMEFSTYQVWNFKWVLEFRRLQKHIGEINFKYRSNDLVVYKLGGI